jgi:hypothetical protein
MESAPGTPESHSSEGHGTDRQGSIHGSEQANQGTKGCREGVGETRSPAMHILSVATLRADALCYAGAFQGHRRAGGGVLALPRRLDQRRGGHPRQRHHPDGGRAQPLDDRNREQQYPRERGLRFRAQRRPRQTAYRRPNRQPDLVGLPRPYRARSARSRNQALRPRVPSRQAFFEHLRALETAFWAPVRLLRGTAWALCAFAITLSTDVFPACRVRFAYGLRGWATVGVLNLVNGQDPISQEV